MDTTRLAPDFFDNHEVCREPVELQVGEECLFLDTNIVDEENDFFAFIPCRVIRIDLSPKYAGRKYYLLQACGSVNDTQLNSIQEDGMNFYKIVENTSPYLIKIKETIEI